MTTQPTNPGNVSVSERLLAEAVALGRQAELSPSRLAELEARIERTMAEERRQLDERIASSRARYAQADQTAQAPRVPRIVQAAALLGLIWLLVGLLFELSLGGGFVFAFSTTYWAAAPWLFFGVCLLSSLVFLRADMRERARRMHQSWVKSWLVLPLSFGAMAALSVAATPGWAAFLGWVAGGPALQVEVQVVSVGSLSRNSRGCDQSADFLVNGQLASLCLERRMAAPALRVGERLVLVGRRWWSGMYVDEIRRP